MAERLPMPYGRPDANLDDRLRKLVVLIATGDRPAFCLLVTFLSPRVGAVARALPHASDVEAVIESTFAEVSRMARWHADDAEGSTLAWIMAIARRRCDERLRGHASIRDLRDEYDRHTRHEFTAMARAAVRGRSTEP
jgi:DNA-directed RNA polymerase specialized sigma24 family protein